MGKSQEIGKDPLRFIQECVRQRRILWTHHVNMRLRGRRIPRRTILDSVDSYEMVEEYPDDKYLPSYLILSRSRHDAFHILFGTDIGGNNVRVITAYRPDPAEWHVDLRTRREDA